MAGIDYNILGQIKPFQLESPMNAMAQAMQLRGLQESSQMNALKAQEYQQQVQERNALARLMGSGIKYGSDEFFNRLSVEAPSFYEKIATGEEKRQSANVQQQLARTTQQQREAAEEEQRRKTRLASREFGLRKIAGAPDYGQAVSMIERSVRAGEIDREEADDMLSRLTPDADMSQFRTQTLTNMLAPEKVFEEQRAAEKATFDIDKLKADKAERKLKLFQSVVPNINTIDGVSQLVAAMYQDPDLGPVLSQVRPYEDAVTANQDLFNQDSENWKLTSSGVNPKDVIEMARNKVKEQRTIEDRAAPKPEKFDLNGKIVTRDMNPYSDTYLQIIATDEKTAAPMARTESNLARLQRERAEIFAANPNDPRINQIDEAIGKETGTTMTAEQKSQAQDREARRLLERERLNLERYKAAKGDGSGRGPGPGTKLEKGEIWNEAEQRIETVPGSKLNIAQSNAHGKDRSALVAVETKTNSAINKIDEILDPKNQDGFDANFSGMVPYGGFVTGRFAPDSRRKIESLKADMKSAGLELIRQGGSIGQITEREWPILEAMIAGISPEMTPEAARAEFTKVRAYMNRLKANAKDAYQTEWGDTQYFKPSPGDKSPKSLSPQDKQALDWANANPKDPRSAKIKQRLGVTK
jgi:hypothetical protein